MTPAPHPLRCRCGALQGLVERPDQGLRATCYCRDCRAFARVLGHPETVLDAHGGTTVVATQPDRVRFTHGIEQLRCLSLSSRGLLRWYAGCCDTPIGNTPRSAKMPYVGIVQAALGGDTPAVQRAFGPVRAVVYTESTHGAVRASSLPRQAAVVLGVLARVLAARLSGRWRDSPFFVGDSDAPLRQPRVLAPDERQRVTDPA